jgi:hypothetical protein
MSFHATIVTHTRDRCGGGDAVGFTGAGKLLHGELSSSRPPPQALASSNAIASARRLIGKSLLDSPPSVPTLSLTIMKRTRTFVAILFAAASLAPQAASARDDFASPSVAPSIPPAVVQPTPFTPELDANSESAQQKPQPQIVIVVIPIYMPAPFVGIAPPPSTRQTVVPAPQPQPGR